MVLDWRLLTPEAVLLEPVVLDCPDLRPRKVFWLALLTLTSREAEPVLLWTVRVLLASVMSLTETADIVPLKFVVGVNDNAPVPVVVITAVWVLVPA